MSVSVIEQLQLDMVARAQAHPLFANVLVTGVRPRDQGAAVLIQTKIDNTLAGIAPQGGKNGAAIIINLPSGSVPNQEVHGPDLQLTYIVRVIENPIINMGATGTGISAEDLMLGLLNLFHLWVLNNIGGAMLADKQPFTPLREFLDQGKIAYDCYFTIRLGIQGIPKTSMPRITYDVVTDQTGGYVTDDAGGAISGSNVAIRASAGASIYYTTDGSYPVASNDAAILYTEPFAAVSGTGVRAVAYAANKMASDGAFKLIP